MPRKGQAALEFLMTYGWAILAAVVVIGALAYFGVFSPSQYAPKMCTLTAPLGCEEHTVNNDSVQMVIRNGFGHDITVQEITVDGCGNLNGTTSINDGDSQLVTIDCTSTLSENFQGDISVTYMKTGGQLNQTSAGQVSGTVA